jgi:hypothetical protein
MRVSRNTAIGLSGYALVMHVVFACWLLEQSSRWAFVQFLCLPLMALGWYTGYWVYQPMFFPRNRLTAFLDTHKKKIVILGFSAVVVFWLPFLTDLLSELKP